MKAIILAGGRATRLGPLTAQMNKALVSVGQRPMIVHQIEMLRRMNVEEFIVVVSPGQREQVEDVLKRSHAGLPIRINTITQPQPLGPANALAIGARYAVSGPVYVLMADTFFELEDLQDAPIDGSWVALSRTNQLDRHWCVAPAHTYGTYRECDEIGEDALVTIGAYRFDNVEELSAACRMATKHDDGEYQMAPVLEEYASRRTLMNVEFKTWLDVGDVRALANAKRQRFITRSFNRLELSDIGVITKYGSGPDFTDEAGAMARHSNGLQAPLFPRVFGAYEGYYEMEYVDLPTLAELWLYWPGRPDMWATILEGIIDRLDTHLWGNAKLPGDGLMFRMEEMYVDKMMTRFEEWDYKLKQYDALRIDGVLCHAGEGLIRQLVEYVSDQVMPSGWPALLHGDLNFSNILYSLSTGTFKLLDPRGSWGGNSCVGDGRYELAKLRYSYADGFASITHGLVDVVGDDSKTYTFHEGPRRMMEIAAMDEVMGQGADLRHIKAIEATILLSSMPLHSTPEAVRLYLKGIQLANEVLHG